MKNSLTFLGLNTRRIYFDRRSVVSSLVKRLNIMKFNLPNDRKSASVSATFIPVIKTLNEKINISYSAYIHAALSSDDKSNNFRIAYVEIKLDALIKGSSNWKLKEFKNYFGSISNILLASIPAVRKATHVIYDLFSIDDVIGEIRVPDMINVFYTKLRNNKKLRE